ncbi:unnamed protein product [Zymoseptoria tritici ST99CH_1A5]|uniref:Uncharacterized protein n=2 Tax=Zymoseptoria tritici TaxID=1047171 RepID=A0A1X7RY40_ZYMT9|nr:unnamed protein product [Zymoseptoria tritici ST99CH_3D7]SMY25996.1 unnamed protein product [Zymoseptoria tritici ST99CH_1A5]
MANPQNAEQSRRRSAGSGPGSPASTQSDGVSGRKSTSGERPVDFRFLNFSNPQEAKNAQTRKSVRSHVTTGQHRNARKAAAESAKQSRKGSQPSSATVSDVDTDSPDASSPTTPPLGAQLPRLNPLDLYPESWHSSLRPVMDHFINTMSVDVPETDPSTREFIRTQFMSLIFSDAASLHTLILLASSHYSKVRGQPSHSIDILQLRGMAIQEINRALVDCQPSGRATSDRMIAAVGKMATYELLFGQRDAFHTHMTGLQRLVAMRGGLQTLGLNGFLERTLLWLDVNAAQITGSPNLYFPPSTYPSTRGHPSPDRRLFVMGLS